MDESQFDPRTWGRPGGWVTETQEVALGRAPDFARRFFARVFKEFPGLASTAVFLQWSKQPDDVYAYFERGDDGICVQVDPHLEYLIVTGRGGQAEYGDWDGDQVPAAFDHLRCLVANAICPNK